MILKNLLFHKFYNEWEETSQKEVVKIESVSTVEEDIDSFEEETSQKEVVKIESVSTVEEDIDSFEEETSQKEVGKIESVSTVQEEINQGKRSFEEDISQEFDGTIESANEKKKLCIRPSQSSENFEDDDSKVSCSTTSSSVEIKDGDTLDDGESPITPEYEMENLSKYCMMDPKWNVLWVPPPSYEPTLNMEVDPEAENSNTGMTFEAVSMDIMGIRGAQVRVSLAEEQEETLSVCSEERYEDGEGLADSGLSSGSADIGSATGSGSSYTGSGSADIGSATGSGSSYTGSGSSYTGSGSSDMSSSDKEKFKFYLGSDDDEL